MPKLKRFVKTSLIGGLIVLLPVGLLLFVLGWVFGLVRAFIGPLTRLVMEQSNLQEYVAILLVIGIIILSCFIVGVIVRTQVGKFVHTQIEARFLRIAPGYNLIKQTVLQFLGDRPSPFGGVALVRLFDSPTLVTAFISDTHANGWYTVFVPTGPNPTSGLIYHVPPEQVHRIIHPTEDVMRSIISCGAGSAALLEKLNAPAPPDGSAADVSAREGQLT